VLEEAWAEAGAQDVFASCWLNDHLTDPNVDRRGPSFEALTTLAALAHLVPGKDVGHTVLAATFRHPSMLVKEAVTLDHITRGHFILGLGAGWHVSEHETFGIDLQPLPERFDRFESQVRIIRALFSREARTEPGVTLDAPPWRLSGAVVEPPPVRPGGPPLWLGGQRPRGLRMAAQYADGWNYAANLGGTHQGFAERRDRLYRACEELGRDPGELVLSVQFSVGREAGPAGDIRKALGYVREGATEVILTTLASEGAAGIRRVAREIAEPIRAAAG
jgi:alkanesulfonate monooxygenase SsuD/methylene tetrahydromethanopterin reductase-like flavin-dependent oxidoreductase (luciferase family)